MGKKGPERWARQEDETSKAFEAFCAYRDMGTIRSINRVSEKLGKSKTVIDRWSRKYDWVERAACWDEEQDRSAREAMTDEITKMRRRHAKLACDMLAKSAAALRKMRIEDIKPADLSRMVDVATKLERLARGDVGDIIEERDGGEAFNPVRIYLPDNNRGRDKESFDDLEV